MRYTIVRYVLAVALAATIMPIDAYSGGTGRFRTPPLDQHLMGFKEQGVWYFPCIAPTHLHRIPPHYATYGPPPPPCCPPPIHPPMYPPKVKQALVKPKLMAPPAMPVRYR